MAWFGVSVPRGRALGVALSAIVMGVSFSFGASASIVPGFGALLMPTVPSVNAIVSENTSSGLTRVGACRGRDCYSPYSEEDTGEPEGACRPTYGEEDEAPQPRYTKECGARCMYQRLRAGHCGPGCDYYLFRMYEYRYGRPPKKRRCNRDSE